MSDKDTPKDDPKPDKDDDRKPDADDKSKKSPEEIQAEADKWKALARKHEATAKQNADAAKKLADLEEADKTELQKATDKVAEAEQRADAAERTALQLEVAIEKAPEGLSLAQVRKLAKRLAGTNREEFEADAEELFAEFTPAEDDKPEDDKSSKRRPRERLKPGAAPEAEPEESDPRKLAETVPRNW